MIQYSCNRLRFVSEPQNSAAMETILKKSNQADLENKKLIFWQIGAIMSLALVFFAFEYRSEANFSMRDITRSMDAAPFEEIPVTVHRPTLPPPPPQPVVNIVAVDNHNQDVATLTINAEPLADESIEPHVPVMEPEMQLDEPVILVPEIAPEFPGGVDALMAYLGRNLNYPARARELEIQGRVYVSFVIEKDGKVSNIKLLRGIGGGCDEEAIRVVSEMPDWKPGRQNGRPARVAYNLPVRFSLK